MADYLTHDQAAELLPWYANGTLEPDEHQAVEAHAASCVSCRRELGALETLATVLADKGSSPLPGDMRRINARIDEAIERGGAVRALLRRCRARINNPWRLATMAQTVLLAAITAYIFLGSTEQESARQPEFTTLTAPESLPAGQYLRLIPGPELTLSEFNAMLAGKRLMVRDGPSTNGVYTLRFDDRVGTADRASALAEFRADERVRFVTQFEIGEER